MPNGLRLVACGRAWTLPGSKKLEARKLLAVGAAESHLPKPSKGVRA